MVLEIRTTCYDISSSVSSSFGSDSDHRRCSCKTFVLFSNNIYLSLYAEFFITGFTRCYYVGLVVEIQLLITSLC